jgi:hypothetical protein
MPTGYVLGDVYPDSIHWRKTACGGLEMRF